MLYGIFHTLARWLEGAGPAGSIVAAAAPWAQAHAATWAQDLWGPMGPMGPQEAHGAHGSSAKKCSQYQNNV